MKHTRPYRAWINQPSTLQPHHKLHGRRCIAVDECDKYATIYFTDGERISMQIDRQCLSISAYQFMTDAVCNDYDRTRAQHNT
jgi:hypothetical protein